MATDHSKTYRQFKLKNLPHILRLRKILRILEKTSNVLSYCDVGCSNGYVSRIVAEHLGVSGVVGYDHQEENLALARQRDLNGSYRFIDLNLDAQSDDSTYDLVTCFETLEHVGNLDNALRTLVCKKSKQGYLLISVPIEVGRIGRLKALLKVRLYGYSFQEISEGESDEVFFRRYYEALKKGDRISSFRPSAAGFGTHFGFDCYEIDRFFESNDIRFEATNSFTTRFYMIGPEF